MPSLGLAGLNAARPLHRAGVNFLLIEARDRPGGRILTVGMDGAPNEDGFDLGPSWLWPDHQPAIGALVIGLGLDCFAQNTDGDTLFERMPREVPHRFPGMSHDLRSMRLTGGSGALIRGLMQDLPPERLRFGLQVTGMRLTDDGVELTAGHGDGGREVASAAQVIATLPPRLLAAIIRLDPAPEAETLHLWHATPTWMAPHAKFFAICDRPFRREAGLCLVGPSGEIHDATTHSGRAALFGFLRRA